LNLYAGYLGNYGKIGIPMESERKYGDLSVMTPPMDKEHPNFNFVNNYNAAWLGGDYTLKPDNTISFELNYNSQAPKTSTLSDLTTYLNNSVISESQSVSNTHGTNNSLQGTLTYHGKWSDKSTFEGDLRYRHSTPTNYSDFTQGNMYSDSYNTQVENFYRVNLDYTYQFNPKFSADIAYGILIDNFNLYQNNQTLTQHQVRNRPSLYLSYNPVKQWSMKAGAMVEFYNQTFMNLKQSQTGFLPFVNIMYKPIDKFSVTAKYRAYPGYPDINSMTTFQTQMDTLTWSVGNPNLKPSNYQEAGLDINFLNHFTVSPFYGFDASNNQQYLYEENGQYYQQPVNADLKKLGVNVNFTLPFKKHFFWQNFLQMSESWLSYNDVSNKQFSYIFNSMLVYSMSKLDATAGIGIQKNITRWGTLQGYNAGGNDIPMVMLQKNFLKHRLSCTLIYVPPFKEGFINYTMDQMTQTPNYYSKDSRSVTLLQNLVLLQINYHFNSGKQVNVKKSSLDNDNNTKQKSGGLGM
jgi:outer membrane receptor protein involved in Fe transport